MKLFVLLTTLVLAAASAQIRKPANPLGDSPQVAEAGRLIYNRSCTGCHGPDGADGDRAPGLDGNRRYFRVSEAAIFETLKAGIPGTVMPASGLPDNDIWKIVTFIRAIRATASDLVVPGSVPNGMSVFNGAGGCVQCHMIRGQGGIIGPDLSSIGAQLNLNRIRDALTRERPIPNGYRPVTATTATGEKITGIARNRDAFSLQVLDAQGKLHLLDTARLRGIVYADKSLMPHDYDKKLTPAQYRDLVAMLAVQARTKVKITWQGENEVGR
ncbi:MAG: c-type cytochrome [Terriglobia bacterium]